MGRDTEGEMNEGCRWREKDNGRWRERDKGRWGKKSGFGNRARDRGK